MGCFEAHHSDILNLKIGLGLQGQQQASIAGRSGLPRGFCYPSATGPWASVSCPFPISGAVVDDSLLCVWGQHLWTLHTGCWQQPPVVTVKNVCRSHQMSLEGEGRIAPG